MSHYHSAGNLPHKRHTQFRGENGALRVEELFSTLGFDGPYALLYHVSSPTEVIRIDAGPLVPLEAWECETHRHHLLDTAGLPSGGDILEARRPLFFNEELIVSVARPNSACVGFYRNALADELVIVAEGEGVFLSPFGRLDYEAGDMIVVPRGTVQDFRPGVGNRLFVIESTSTIEPPSRYFAGRQFAEHSPFCERDIKIPVLQPPVVERGDFSIRTKLGRAMTIYGVANHPFDIIGWDGSLYPYAINMRDFEPVTRRIHTMPDEQQAFSTKGAAICCLVPRLMDYHPDALPTPPVHSSIDCDEILINLGDRFMGWERPSMGFVTFHPRGLPHGPKPGTPEKSIGMKEFDGEGVLIDAFRPIRLAYAAHACDDPAYYREWLAPPVGPDDLE
jgi:homogentisate 1,2-dioxygenase